MKPVVRRFIGNCDSSVQSINRLLVSAYLKCRGLVVDNGSILIPYIIHEDDEKWDELEHFCQILKVHYPDINLEDLIDFFEFVVSPSDKVVTGAIYTPQYIRKAIVDYLLQLLVKRDFVSLRIADIACGCGGFLLSVCENILSFADLDCHYIYEHILYGCDIEEYCIERSKILLTLKALEMGERTDNLVFNLYQGNSLIFDWNFAISNFSGFDAIVGNPPYVTSSKMSVETKDLLNNWKVCSSGKADLYIPFFQIAIELLNDSGVLGYITVNNFYRSLNGKALRDYFAEHQLNLTIVDFGGEQVFKGCSTYTCLCFVNKQLDGMVRFTRTMSKAINEVSNLQFVEAVYNNLNSAKGWVIKDCRINNILKQIENTGTPLGNTVSISNGLATLKNELFVLNVVEATEKVLIHKYEDTLYPIERTICKQVVKPSTMDIIVPLQEQIGWIIYPYEIHGSRITCFDELKMQEQFPYAFAYLQSVREVLDKRDKGKRKYEQWYAYGRSQAINLPGKRLFMPYIANAPTFMLSDIDGLLYYNGFALISNDIHQLERLKKILDTNLFWFYVKNISKPYANGYYSMGKRYIRYFGIPNFTKDQLVQLDALTGKDDLEEFLYWCYFGEKAELIKKIIESDF